MAAMRADQQAVAHAEIARLLFIRKLQLGAAPQHHHPFRFSLVVPETLRAARQAGVDPLQAPAGALD